MAEINWTAEQQAEINKAITTETENSRLAHKLIHERKFPPNARSVPKDQIDDKGNINETHEKLHEETAPFDLIKPQTEDQDLSVALMKVRRAAQQLARKHDEYVFVTTIRDPIEKEKGGNGFNAVKDINKPYSDNLVAAIASAVADLDGKGHRSGYVMVAGLDVYENLFKREANAADLPIKAVQGLLEDGPVHRSAVLQPNEALILSISGEEMDRAVALPPTLEFLRIKDDNSREFRLYERYLPRFKQPSSAVLLRLN